MRLNIVVRVRNDLLYSDPLLCAFNSILFVLSQADEEMSVSVQQATHKCTNTFQITIFQCRAGSQYSID